MPRARGVRSIWGGGFRGRGQFQRGSEAESRVEGEQRFEFSRASRWQDRGACAGRWLEQLAATFHWSLEGRDLGEGFGSSQSSMGSNDSKDWSGFEVVVTEFGAGHGSRSGGSHLELREWSVRSKIVENQDGVGRLTILKSKTEYYRIQDGAVELRRQAGWRYVLPYLIIVPLCIQRMLLMLLYSDDVFW